VLNHFAVIEEAKYIELISRHITFRFMSKYTWSPR